MNTLKSLSSEVLWQKTKSLVLEERRITTEILWCLRENHVRDLHVARGYPSLHEYCVKELGYSDGAAHRRIESMRLLVELPEIEEKIQSGAVNLSTVATLGMFFKQEKKAGKKYAIEEKRELLAQIEGKSRRETDAVLAEINPRAFEHDCERAISETEVELKIRVPKALIEKLRKIRAQTSHKNPNPSYAGLIDMLADTFLEKPRASPGKLTDPAKRTRYIPKPTRDKIPQNGCEYVDPKTGRRCSSTHFLQLDHIQPYSQGGDRSRENLRWLCGPHNRHVWATR